MFSWGQQSAQGFRLKDGTYDLSNHRENGAFLDLDFLITDLSAGLRVLSFVKTNGDAFLIRVQSKDGTRVSGKQISVQWKERFQAVACTDDVVILLSNKGQVIYVDTNLPPLKPRNLEEPPVLCRFPFIMDLRTKKDALYLNRTVHGNSTNLAEVPMVDVVVDLTDFNFEDELDYGLEDDDFYFEDDDFYAFTSPFTLKLRRECVMEDTFKQLAVINCNHFKKDLVVYFNDINIFDNVNQKDFFHLVFHEMVSVESGMFMFNDSATLAWFPSRPSHPVEHYFLFGVLCGLGVFNLYIIFLPFPLALFKKLLGVRPSLDDLCQLSPCTGQSLRCLLEEYSDEVIESLDMDFRIYWDGTEVHLDPNTPERPVTGQNKEGFVKAFVDHIFTSSVQREFEEFRRGFFEACDRHLVELFSPEELQGIMVGQDFNHWGQFKQSTVYEGIYEESHPTILMFWEVFDELTVKQKKALLWFDTGFVTVPILSEKKIMTIQELSYRKEGVSKDQYYPKSYTCMNKLHLPLYSSKEIMKNKLIESLAQISPKQFT